MRAEPPALPAGEAYRLWAPAYDRDTVVSALDERAVDGLSPPPRGRALLDAGCGTGRRLRAAAGVAREAVGVDLVPEMLLAGRRSGEDRLRLVSADVRALPLGPGRFDLVWCRLVVGHVAELDAVYRELGRVSAAGAHLVVTDFHPAAAARGHVRSFRDGGGRLHTIVHHVHAEADHARAAAAAGWRLTGAHHLAPGPPERRLYEEAGRAGDYDAHRSLPLVLALCMTR